MKLTKEEAEEISGVYNGLGVSPTPSVFMDLKKEDLKTNIAEIKQDLDTCNEYFLEVEKLQSSVRTEIMNKLQS